MLQRMRTTIDITDELLLQARKRAADQRMPLRKIMEAALRAYLSSRPRKENYRLQWRTERGRLRPGVDLDDRNALFDLMDGRR